MKDEYYRPEIRKQCQKFGYDKSLLKGNFDEEGFLKYLDVDVPDSAPSLGIKGKEHFCDMANAVARAIKDRDFPNLSTIVFRDTGDKTPPGHVTGTQCKPDITAAFEGDWENDVVCWPFIRLAGEKASAGKTPHEQEIQAISYLHYLLLARPDLYVAQGLLTSDAGVTFFFGIGGSGIRKFQVEWARKDLYRLLYAFIHRLYDPGDFADPSYIKTEFDEEYAAKYTLNITYGEHTQECPGFHSLYARNPFGTRTHILSNPEFKFEGGDLTIFKDQFCRVGRRFEEFRILTEHIHKPQGIPGVVVATYGETIISRHLSEPDKRCKHRLGLGETGLPFTGIPTLQEVLETLFDVLEVLRYLRLYRKVLHRDISSGNVLYVEESSKRLLPPNSMSAQDAKTNGYPLCYAKFLLEKTKDPLETSMLLVDFNLAEHLGSETNVTRIERTGTPLFIARAVERNGPVPALLAYVPEIPESPAPYATFHPDRVEKFPSSIPRRMVDESKKSTKPWRHELQHDAESVFWLLLYWAMGAQPIKDDKTIVKEEIARTSWTMLIGKSHERDGFIRLLSDMRMPDNITHSFYKPLQPLIENLAAILIIDSHHLDAQDPRSDIYYVTEAFQRLILKFMIENRREEFMRHRVAKTFRKEEGAPHSDAMSATDTQLKDSRHRSGGSGMRAATNEDVNMADVE